jgi:hypothetical protein
MTNIWITDNDTAGVILEGHADTDGVLVNAALTEETFAAGTILARNTATGKFEPFDPGVTPPSDLLIPKAVLTYEVADVAASGEVPVRVLTSGKVNQRRLVIHGGTPVTALHADMLRDYSIVALDVKQLARDDNPQA